MLVNWAVGEDAPVFSSGNAKRIPAGATLIFQVHYTTNGTPGRDRSKIGLILAKEPPAREIRTGLIANPVFSIPPGAAVAACGVCGVCEVCEVAASIGLTLITVGRVLGFGSLT